jgi:hypothetical protein
MELRAQGRRTKSRGEGRTEGSPTERVGSDAYSWTSRANPRLWGYSQTLHAHGAWTSRANPRLWGYSQTLHALAPGPVEQIPGCGVTARHYMRMRLDQ